jgi:tetratricopeptide (TPR) repeat protein
LGWAGTLANLQGDSKTARPLLEEAVHLSRQLGDRQRLEMSLTMSGLAALFLDDIQGARSVLEESIELGRALNNKFDLASALAFLSYADFRGSGDLEGARPYFDESIRLGREIGDKIRVADTLNNWGLTAFGAGEYEEARRSFQASMTIYEAAHNALFINISRSGLADVARRLGDYDSAEALYRESLAEWDRLGNRGAMARVIECLAFVAKARALVRATHSPAASLRHAALLLSAADALRTTSGNPMTGAERGEYAVEIADLRAMLDAPAFGLAWAEGQHLTPEHAIELALSNDL